MDNPFSDIFSWERIAVSLVLPAVGFLLAFIIRKVEGQDWGRSALIGLETSLTMLAGMYLAQLTVAVPIWLGDGSTAAEIGTGFFFLIWPGIVNLFAAPFTEGALIGANGLTWCALAVGAGIGFYDGFRRIHKWMGPGVLTFLGDLTWGLPLSVNALIIHLINTYWGDEQGETRRGAHRYKNGFALKSGFAFTQGNVLSNLNKAPGDPLYIHEQTHVMQNRVFGPFFWVTYFGWFILWAIVAAIAWLCSWGKNSANVRLANHYFMWWPYFNNPWELWAYTHNPTARTGNLPPGDGLGWLDWPGVLKVIFSILGLAILLGLTIISVWRIWFS
jgi:hypothetical protein